MTIARLVFIDRDGTLIKHVPYLHDPAQVEILPTVREGLTLLIDQGCRLFLHTNQSGIGRGYFSLADAMACNDEMLKQLGMGADLFEDVCISPETPDQPVVYRKPSPKFALEVMARLGSTPHNLCYIGDNVSDLLAAENAGGRGVGVNTGEHDLPRLMQSRGLAGRFPVLGNFLEAAQHVAVAER
jgi:D-glycero-D-manno-heptose 1,7-bisphosphate phosphatase